MQTLFGVLAVLCLHISLWAQPMKESDKNTGNTTARIIIRGKVVDTESGKEMEYANVSVFNSNDSTLVSGGITNAEGEFRIENLAPGNFYVEANFIGFNKTRINNIEITSSNRQIDMGTIRLEPSTQEISTVEVVAQRPRVEYKVDKKIINVSQDIHADGGTAVDALENTPSVQVDVEGNVSLRGSSSFTVLIDGRPSVLTGSDALQQIPASAIENIEIITNPSARYDPDGVAGIINVVMKENVRIGINGIVNTMIGTNDKKRLDATFNHKTAKRNFTFGVDLNDRSFSGDSYSSRETYGEDGTSSFLIKEGDRDHNRGGYRFKGGADFFLSERTSLGLIGDYGHYRFEGGGSARILQYTEPASITTYSVEKDPSKRTGNYVSGNINLLHKFNAEGTHKLEALAYYSHRTGDDRDEESEYSTGSDYEASTGAFNIRLRTTEDESDNRYRFQLDYTLSLGTEGRLEAGLQSRLDRSDEDYLMERFNQTSQNWKKDEDFSNFQEFSRDIHSAYITLSNSLGPLQYMLGGRGEYTRRETNLPESGQNYLLDRFDFFPTVHLSWQLPGDYQLMTSYSRRINRPRGRDLDPFPQYIDQYSIRQGNPGLSPEYTNSWELGLMKRFGPSFLSLESFYRITDDMITYQEALGDDDILYGSTVNLNKDYSLGAELMGDVNLTKWLQVNSSLSLYNYRIEDESEEELTERESTNLDGRFNVSVKLASNSKLQLMSMYRGSSVSSQGDRGSMLFTNLAFRQDLLNKKLTATVSIRDIFGTGKMKNNTEGLNFRSHNKWSREPRIVSLILSYKINNFKNEKNTSDDTNEMDFGNMDF